MIEEQNPKNITEMAILPMQCCQQLNLLYDGMLRISAIHLQLILEKLFTQNSRTLFDKIICSMGTIAFYKKGEPLWSHETEDIIGIEEMNTFLSDWDDILKLTGNDIVIDKNGTVVS